MSALTSPMHILGQFEGLEIQSGANYEAAGWGLSFGGFSFLLGQGYKVDDTNAVIYHTVLYSDDKV